MDLKIGEDDTQKIMMGQDEVQKIYLGQDLIYDKDQQGA